MPKQEYVFVPEQLLLTVDLRANKRFIALADEKGEIRREKLSKLAKETRIATVNPIKLCDDQLISIWYGHCEDQSKKQRAYNKDRKIISEFVRKAGIDERASFDMKHLEKGWELYIMVQNPAIAKVLNYSEEK